MANPAQTQLITKADGTPDRRYRKPSRRHVESIKVGKIIHKLNKVAQGKDDMTRTQFDAARLLLNKAVPDARPEEGNASQIKDITHSNPHALLTIIEGQADRK